MSYILRNADGEEISRHPVPHGAFNVASDVATREGWFDAMTFDAYAGADGSVQALTVYRAGEVAFTVLPEPAVRGVRGSDLQHCRCGRGRLARLGRARERALHRQNGERLASMLRKCRGAGSRVMTPSTSAPLPLRPVAQLPLRPGA